MDKEKLAPWIERLNKAAKKDRNAIVEEMAKENHLKSADAWKLLQLNGFDPKSEPQADPQVTPPIKPEGKKQSVVLRHKTQYPGYRRAGLVLTQIAAAYDVTDEQLAVLKKDPWVVIGKDKGEDKKEGAKE